MKLAGSPKWLCVKRLVPGLMFVLLLLFGKSDTVVGARFNSIASEKVYLPVMTRAEPLPPPPPGCTYIAPDNQVIEQQTMDGLNQIRANHGLNRLAIASELVHAARRHSRDMADNNFFNHIGSDGSNPYDRMVDACYQPNGYGEIIAAGYPSAEAVIQAWMDSAGHRDVILTSYYSDFGAGYAVNPNSTYVRYWTVNFSLPLNPSMSPTSNTYLCTYTLEEEGRISMLRINSPEPCQ